MSQRRLHIASTLSLPLEFATSTQAILAIRGAGKTYTASVVAEEMLKSKVPVIVIDPTGSWWGLKSSKDGASAGYPIVVFGGEHADVPLEDTAGEVIARAIVEHRFSAILDLKLLRKGQWYRLLAPFLETLYHLNREPVHLFVDEAHRIAPQRLAKGAVEPARVLGAMEDIAQMGRSRGLGCTVISQRPAVINKNVLTQCPVLCCLRVVHNLDLDAVRDWVKEQADLSEADEMIRTLPSLPTGDAWFWWPEEGIQKRVRIRERETFDSSKTPKVGEKIRPPKVMAEVDIQQLGEQIKATVERAKADDPKALKARVQQLERELKKRPTEPVAVLEKRVEVPKIVERRIEVVPKEVKKEFDRLQDKLRLVQGHVELLSQAIGKAPLPPAYVEPKFEHKTYGVSVNLKTGDFRNLPDGGPLPKSTTNGDDSGHLKTGALRLLSACAQWYPKWISASQVASLSKMKARGGSFTSYKSNLVTGGYIEVQGNQWRATEKGVSHTGLADVGPPPSTTDEVLALWRTKLKPGAMRVLQTLIDSGEEINQDELSARAEIRGGSFTSYLSNLTTAGLIVKPFRGVVAANREALFLD